MATVRKRYRFKTREAAEAAHEKAQQRCLHLLWMHCQPNTLIKRSGHYSLYWFQSPNSHFEIYVLKFHMPGNGIPSFEFFESVTECRHRLTDAIRYKDSQDDEFKMFDALITSLDTLG